MSSSGAPDDSEAGLFLAIRKIMSGNKPDHASQSGEAEDLVLDQRVEPEKPKDLGRDSDDDALVLGPTTREAAVETPAVETIDRDKIVDQAAKDHDIDEPIAASDSDDAKGNAVIGDDVATEEIFTADDDIGDDDIGDKLLPSSDDVSGRVGQILAATDVAAEVENVTVAEIPGSDDRVDSGVTIDDAQSEPAEAEPAEGNVTEIAATDVDDGDPAGDETAPDDNVDVTGIVEEDGGLIRSPSPVFFGMSAASDRRVEADEADVPVEVEAVSQRDEDETIAVDARQEFSDANSGAEEQSGDPDDLVDVVAMSDPQDLEETIRRVVREELSGEMGQRLSLNLQRIIRDEVTRALRSRG